MREFFRGAGMLLRGFRYWGRRPGLMLLGIVPALIVGIVLVTGFVLLAVNLPSITDAVSPWADGWDPFWRDTVRVALGAAFVGGALVLVGITFTALTLLIGEPFYERIWRAVESDLGGDLPESRYGFWRSVGDAVSLIARGILVALLAFAVGFVPVVGGALGFLTGVLFGGLLIADELSSRALTARGIPPRQRRMLRRGAPARVLGFGAATQLCFLVPFGAVLTMPAAVAGATELSRSLLPAAPAR